MTRFFFFFNDTATTEIYTLSLHDALPIFIDCLIALAAEGSVQSAHDISDGGLAVTLAESCFASMNNQPSSCHSERRDRKSTRLNSSHSQISYAVFCLKKKKTKQL